MNTTNPFQQKIKKDITNLNKLKSLLIKADKTTNFYQVTSEKYSELLKNNITKEYCKTSSSTVEKITAIDKSIASSLELSDRVEVLAQKQAFITLKDHKPNFNNNTQCRLINPTKSEIGSISKQILDKINNTVIEKTGLLVWKNSHSVINWFKNLKNKPNTTFISFDVCDFYPSISEGLLDKALCYAENFTNITPENVQIIKHEKVTFSPKQTTVD
jgi:ethanolamine utilization protein EutQ (cupin superfamily)